MIEFVWLIPAIMFLAALVNGLGVRRLGKTAGHIAWMAMALCCVISFVVLFQVIGLSHDPHWAGTKILLWHWFDIPNFFGPNRTFSVEMAFHVDQLTTVFLCFVSFIGTLVFIYATGYMKEKHGGHLELDPGYARFFAFVCLFAASMFTLVLGANLAVMFIGWEGVGLCSYLLIGYYFDKPFSENLSCADAGRKAFVVNRIGDAGLLIGIGLLFWGLGTLDFAQINDVLISGKLADGSPIPDSFKYGGLLITAATLCMFFGATGKSAQIPLFTWLPDAMAGPTPVSALIHAATMVTAGVYMVARMNVAYFLSPGTMAVVAIIGALTAFAAATMGLTQRGIKKALAYSTVSQLGYMFLGLGVGAMAGGIFHVFTHAFFKGCLFLAAGSVIHALHHEEDMFKMGGLKKYMPKTWLAYAMATLAIAGFPLTSGFFSKDEILYSAWLSAGDGVPVLWIIGVITAVMTAIYMGRTLFLTFHGKERLDDHAREHVHESPSNMTMPILVLGGLGLIVGFLNVPHALTFGVLPEAKFHHFLAPVVDRGAEHVAALRGFETDHATGMVPSGPLIVAGNVGEDLLPTAQHHHAELLLAISSAALGILGLGIAWWFFGAGLTERSRKLARTFQPLWKLSFHRWWWDDFYNTVFRDGTMLKARAVWKTDVAVVDGAVVGIAEGCRSIGRGLRRIQNGQVQTYGLVMFIGICMFLLYFAFGLNNFLSQSLDETQGRKVLQMEPSKRSLQGTEVQIEEPAREIVLKD
ncbi:MAG: NADH-quinone oxidoreductase subunit [Candidatus Sumerlaeota bacterium]|nr:NADH-quinone oxidoreductase subunit [Candidatus Sumerlaeota bacterium]